MMQYTEVKANDITQLPPGPARRHPGDRPPSKQDFMCWDGEGVTVKDEQAQRYVLLGHNLGSPLTGTNLHTRDCLQYIVSESIKFPRKVHVGFAFDYDVNMILRDLSPEHFKKLREVGHVRWEQYNIEHIPHKWIEIYSYEYKHRVRIQDTFSFFQTSFLSAVDQYIPTHPLVSQHLKTLSEGKAARNDFTLNDMEYIKRYWRVEIDIFAALIAQLQTYLHDVGLPIRKWHGPGAIASHLYKTHGIEKVKRDCPDPVVEAARYAYSGGRFELYNAGRHQNVYSIDLNSAYPAAIAELPDLSQGEWVHVQNPAKLVRFGVYKIAMNSPELIRPAPLFHRDAKGLISYPHTVSGWYWTPEALHAQREGATITEGWEFRELTNNRPFSFVRDLYAQRRELKRNKVGSQLALKLALNSLYGKMAQRTGWTRTMSAPEWHQLAWAGWVTSSTRAALYDVIRQIPQDKLIAVETDGIYTTLDPETLGLTDSKELGGWEFTHYDEMLYLQNGVYSYRQDTEWSMKYRGLDKGSFTPEDFADTLKQCDHVTRNWPVLSGTTTRFLGYPVALQGKDFYDKHRHWVTTSRELQLGNVGKRRHHAVLCPSCRKRSGSSYDHPHRYAIASVAYLEPESHMHDIPWLEGTKRYDWRDYDEKAEW